MIISNIVKKEQMREVQSETLQILREALACSFGPYASNTIIAKAGALNKYTKDGHSILKDIQFQNVIENSVKMDLEDITRHIVKTIGDGTTSAVILSSIIFEKLKELESEVSPYQLIRDFKTEVEKMKKIIEENAQEFNADKAYDISLISTNGNTTVAENIKKIYEEYGNDVFIDVSISNTEESLLKTFDGMTLSTGYSDTAFINNNKKGVCSLRNASVYYFEDPVDTAEMFALFDSIIEKNIMSAYVQGATSTPVPTVILAPMVSRDLSSYMDRLVNFMYKFEDEATKPPFLLITNMHEKEQMIDIARLCGCKPIKKYINLDQQNKDIEQGLAPTIETIVDFCGQADIVEADVTKTKFVNPALMHDENGEYSVTYNTLLSFLQAELQKAIEANEDNNVTGTLKRRINSLKANMVEYLVGGVSMSDRDVVRDLVEDSVLNCRSAARFGVGYGANFEGLRASEIICNDSKAASIINRAYIELICTLYNTKYSVVETNSRVQESVEKQMPVNLKTNEFDGRVLCSIKADIVILDAISQIITLMFTSNQFLVPTVQNNKYLKL